MLDIVCTPTPFIVGLLSSSLPRLKELPIEEVRWVFLCLWCTDCGALDSSPSLNNKSRKWHHAPSALPSGPGGRPLQQPLPTTGRNHRNKGKLWKSNYCHMESPFNFITHVVTLPAVMWIQYVNSLLTVFTSVSFTPQLDDEDSILPHKLQAALEHVLDKRRELACEKGDLPNGDSSHLLQYSLC